MVILIFNFPKESDIFDQPGFDVFIIHELAKDVKLLSEKLVCEIHLKCQNNSNHMVHKKKATSTTEELN